MRLPSDSYTTDIFFSRISAEKYVNWLQLSWIDVIISTQIVFFLLCEYLETLESLTCTKRCTRDDRIVLILNFDAKI